MYEIVENPNEISNYLFRLDSLQFRTDLTVLVSVYLEDTLTFFMSSTKTAGTTGHGNFFSSLQTALNERGGGLNSVKAKFKTE